MVEDKESRNIPFVKPVRVGNFKLWRSRVDVGRSESGEKLSVIVLNVSTIDGLWQVKIPQTYEMYGIISMLYSDVSSDASYALLVIFGNMLYASSIGNGYYHRALEIAASVYASPSLLDDIGVFHKEIDSLAEEFLSWKRSYDEDQALSEPTEEELHQEDVADQALGVLENQESSVQ